MPIEIQRDIAPELKASAKSYPVVTITGPRQSGKTTLARQTFPNKPYVNLEVPDVRNRALTDPRAFLANYPDGAILDEIQRTPELLSYMQAIVDENEQNGQFILTGSHQLALQEGIAQSLAGRTGLLHLLPCSQRELSPQQTLFSLEDQLFYGGYPRIYKHNLTPQRFYRDYVQTYLERDIKQMMNVKNIDQFQRFLSLCAARAGQLIDYTRLANDLGIARQTVKEWISLLKASFIVLTLPPYFENFGKRIIKSPKLYFTDTGLLSYLLGIQDSKQLANHPLRGEIFENFVITELIKTKYNAGIEPKFYFYRDNHQNEVDVIFQQGLELVVIEIKSSQTFHAQFLKGLLKFKKIADTKNPTLHLIYAGDPQTSVETVRVINYRDIASLE